MVTFIVDERVSDLARALLPEDIGLDPLDPANIRIKPDWHADRPVLAAIALAGHTAELRAALSESPFAHLNVIELDARRPEAGRAELTRFLLDRVIASQRQIGEARAIAAQLRLESVGTKSRLREIEQLLYSLGNPQLSNALSWQPTGTMLTLATGQAVAQALPINAVGLTAIDLWFPQVIMPEIDELALTIESASGQIHRLQAISPDMGLETGWLRFGLSEPIAGVGCDCRLKLVWSGRDDLSLGLGTPVPDPRFRAAVSSGTSPEETLALRAWHSLGGVRLPACTPSFPNGRAVSIQEAAFVQPSMLPRPELFAQPATAADHVSTGFWEREDVILVHPSRSGTVCAIIRGVELSGLSHVSALVTSGHARSPNLNFAIGVAPHGAVDEDGNWSRRIGPWVTGLPARGWAQAHCIPVEPITGKADILLAVSLAADVPNDMSWGLFRGFRFSRDERNGSREEPRRDVAEAGALAS